MKITIDTDDYVDMLMNRAKEMTIGETPITDAQETALDQSIAESAERYKNQHATEQEWVDEFLTSSIEYFADSTKDQWVFLRMILLAI